MNIDLLNLSGKEVYAVVDINQKHVSFSVLVYEKGQFYFLFNERLQNKEEDFEKRNKIADNLKKLLKEAERFFNFQFTKISFNISSENIKIKKSFYIHEFEDFVVFDKDRLEEVNRGFFLQQKEPEGYKNFFGKIVNYFSIDERKEYKKIKFNERVKALKVNGLIYQLPWKNIIFYDLILKKAGVKKTKPILFPYVALTGILFSKKNKKTAIVIWNEDKCTVFYFFNNIFLAQFEINNSISFLIKKIVKKFKYSYEDVKKFVFLFLDFKKNDNKVLEICLESSDPRLNQIKKDIRQMSLEYLKEVSDEIILKFKKEIQDSLEDIEFNVVGDVQSFTKLQNFFNENYKNISWKVNFVNFIGIKDYRDLFVIGNAYFQHLEKKLMYN